MKSIIDLRSIPYFDGTGDLERFINIATSVIDYQTEDQDRSLWLDALKTKLGGRAYEIGKNAKTWTEFKTDLLDRFRVVQTVEDVEAKITGIKFFRNIESIEEYLDRLKQLFNCYIDVLIQTDKISMDAAKSLAEYKIIKFAIEGLDDPIKTTLRAMDLKSVREAYVKIRRLVHLEEEQICREEVENNSNWSKFNNNRNDNSGNYLDQHRNEDYLQNSQCSRFVEPPNGQFFNENKDIFSYSHQYRHNNQRRFTNKYAKNNFYRQGSYNKYCNSNFNFNFNKNRNNHGNFNSTKPTYKTNQSSFRRYNDNFRNFRGYNDRRSSDIQFYSSKKSYQTQETMIKSKQYPVKTNNINIRTTDNVVLNLFVDSGAEIGLIKKSSLVGNILINTMKSGCLSGISPETKVKTLGTCELKLLLKPGIIIEHTFHVVDDNFPIGNSGVLGNDFLQKYNVDISYGNNSLKLHIPDNDSVSLNMHTDKKIKYELEVKVNDIETQLQLKNTEPINKLANSDEDIAVSNVKESCDETMIYFHRFGRNDTMGSISDQYINIDRIIDGFDIDLDISLLFDGK